jgi:hypothetical protein
LNFSERVGAHSSLRGAFGTSKTMATANMSQIAVAHTAVPSVSGMSPSTGNVKWMRHCNAGPGAPWSASFQFVKDADVPLVLLFERRQVGQRIRDECLRVDSRRIHTCSCWLGRGQDAEPEQSERYCDCGCRRSKNTRASALRTNASCKCRGALPQPSRSKGSCGLHLSFDQFERRKSRSGVFHCKPPRSLKRARQAAPRLARNASALPSSSTGWRVISQLSRMSVRRRSRAINVNHVSGTINMSSVLNDR